MSATFSYTEPTIVGEKLEDKWYIYYTLIFDSQPEDYRKKVQKIKQPRKDYGKKYKLSLSVENLETRKANSRKLLVLIKEDLKKQVDPRFTKQNRDVENVIEIEQAKKVSLDEAIQITKIENGWINPTGTAELSSANIVSYLNASFREYVTRINKQSDVCSITQDELLAFLEENYRSKKWMLQTCVNMMNWTSYLFNALKNQKLIPINPCLGSQIKKKFKKIKLVVDPTIKITTQVKKFEIWTSEELIDFETVTNTDQYRMYFTIGWCCYLAFIRRSEVLRLKLEHINLAKKRFEIPSTLTKSARKYDSPTLLYVKMNDRLVKAVASWIDFKFGEDQNPEYMLFPAENDNYKQRSYTQFPKNYAPIKELLISDKMPYGLKHTGVTELFHTLTNRSIAPMIIMETLQKACRHSTFAETMRYLSNDLGLTFETTDDLSW